MQRNITVFFSFLCLGLLVWSFGSAPAEAQRLIPWQTVLSVTAGVPGTQDGFFKKDAYDVSADFSQYFKSRNYYFVGGEFRHRNYRYQSLNIPVEEYLLHAGYMHPVLVDYSKTVLLYLGLSATGGYQELNRGVRTLENGGVLSDRSRFVYGTTPQASLEIFLSDSFLFTMRGRAMFLWGTDLELFYPSLLAGFKINF